jgi:hypothetical protein
VRKQRSNRGSILLWFANAGRAKLEVAGVLLRGPLDSIIHSVITAPTILSRDVLPRFDSISQQDTLPRFRNCENVKVAVLAGFWDRHHRGEDRFLRQLFAYIDF